MFALPHSFHFTTSRRWAKDGGFSRSPAEVLALMTKMVDAISDLHSRRVRVRVGVALPLRGGGPFFLSTPPPPLRQIALGKVGLSSFQFALNTGGEMQIRFSDFESGEGAWGVGGMCRLLSSLGVPRLTPLLPDPHRSGPRRHV